jgi:cytochrome c oxidase subunit 2
MVLEWPGKSKSGKARPAASRNKDGKRTMRIATLFAWIMVGLTVLPTLAAAEGVAGRPVDGAIGFQRPVTEVGHDILWLDNFVLWIIAAISAFVMILLLIVIFRFNRRANPKAATFTHNPTLEVIWTAIPVVILVIIAIPSLRLLFLQLEVPAADLTIKATGNQWFWSYEYPDQDIAFDAFMIGQGTSGLTEEVKAELEANGYGAEDYLLATDNRVVVPVNAVVHVLVTGSDVIHAWTVPSFGSKIDAVPGRINETWFRAEEPGTYYGQCSELCGKDHAYMPIVVEVVTQDEFQNWVATQQAKDEAAPTRLAAAQ